MTSPDGPDKTMPLGGAIAAAAYNTLDRCVNVARRWRRSARHTTPTDGHHHLETLRRDGYAILPDFYSAVQCAQLIADIDRMMQMQPEVVRIDGAGADSRVFGAERFSPLLSEYGAHSMPRTIGEAYSRGPLLNLCTLAGRLHFALGNLGSGQGWHRDAFHFQYKAMVYLTDVTIENGPFQIFAGSHRAANAVRDTIRGRLSKVPDSRVSEEQVARLIAAEPARVHTLIGSRGTLILFDSSTIHRGAPIQVGTRYALTNYYFRPDQCGPVLMEKFAPYARPEATG